MALRLHRLRRYTRIVPVRKNPETLQPWTADIILWVLLAFALGGMLYTVCTPNNG